VDLAVDFTLLILLSVTALAIVRQTNLFAAVTLTAIFSFLSAALFTVMDAVDVAFTEAAVGAGISTVLFLACLSLVGSRVRTPQFRLEGIATKIPPRRPLFPLVVVTVTGGMLAFGTLDMPPFGDPANPVHHHVADHYLEDSRTEIGIPNVVTSVLASYRGYDTLGEATVVFTAAVGVMILLSGLRRRDHLGQEAWGEEGVTTLDPGMGAAFQEDDPVNRSQGEEEGGDSS
jgi:multicomponent Na+:H+ antiporter subunit B